MAETTPAVRLCAQAERVADREHRVTDRRPAAHHRRHHDLGQLVDGEDGDVAGPVAGLTVASARVPSANAP